MPTLAAVARAFVWRDHLLARSDRFGFVLRVASVLVALMAFSALARFIAPVGAPAGAPAGAGGELRGGLVGFWVVGLAMGEHFHVVVSAWSTRLRQAQLEGTLEAVLSTPTRDGHVVLVLGLHDLLVGLLRSAIYLGAGAWLFELPLVQARLGAAFAVFALAMVAFVGLGLLGGALTMALRRADPIAALAWVGAVTLGGVFYPVAALPEWLQPLTQALPIAPALAGMRAALLGGQGLDGLGGELAALAGFAVVVWPLAIWLLARVLRSARRDGSLGQF